MVTAIVNQMKKYSAQWSAYNTKAENETLHKQAQEKANQLKEWGVEVDYDEHKGTWTIRTDENNPSNVGKLLYSCYHTGGIVGDDSTLEDNEVLAKLEKGESVLTEKMWDNLTAMVDRISKLSSMVDKLSNYTGSDALLKAMTVSAGSTVSNVTNNNRPITITFGDTRIEGQATDKTVQEHVKVTYEMMNEVARMLKVKL